MEATGAAAVSKPRLPVRVVVGLCLTGVSLVFLVFPGGLVMPVMGVAPLFTARPSPCFNFLAGPIAFGLFGLAFLTSLALIALGVISIVLAAKRVPAGFSSAVIVDAIVATLFLLVPFSFTPGEFSSPGEYAVNAAFYSAFALIPLAAVGLMLARSFYRSSALFFTTLVVAGVLLMPGAVESTVFGLNVAGVSTAPAAKSAPATHHC